MHDAKSMRIFACRYDDSGAYFRGTPVCQTVKLGEFGYEVHVSHNAASLVVPYFTNYFNNGGASFKSIKLLYKEATETEFNECNHVNPGGEVQTHVFEGKASYTYDYYFRLVFSFFDESYNDVEVEYCTPIRQLTLAAE
ncbi:MAG: hypothetical protein LIP09_05520 [Bacteroidales bacterium]|nr:hypothetical protein [Bacteroidales bacterium]